MSRDFSGILAFLDQDTGDGRRIESIRWEDSQAPWPLTFRIEEGGHEAPVVGQIDRVWIDGDALRGEGVIHDDSENPEVVDWAGRAIELITEGVLGVSIEMDDEDVEMRVRKEVWDGWLEAQTPLDGEEIPEPEIKEDRVVVDMFKSDDWLEVVTDGRFRGAALVHTPAFADASVAVAASIGLAAATSVRSAFANPRFGIDGDEDPRLVWQAPERSEENPGGWGCPLTINDDGSFFGHATLRFRCHGSFLDSCLNPPSSDESLDRWLVGEAVKGIRTGPIWNGGSHGVDHHGRVKDPDWLAKTSESVADATAGFDTHGMWVAGRLRSGLSDRQLEEIHGSGLSAEWHPYGSKLRCIGVLFVNGPAYNIRRRAIAASGGVITLGASCCSDQAPSLEDEVGMLKRMVGQMLIDSVRRF